ncbi:hypothetical protein LTR78_004205 [Recurvomyces mirabilis]|uniref:Uncharacterized protein n=1 Tax=Recurvomyces mirabilis TaxID=574656 RepID=A0AAE0WQB2_9PEZI|nr:hypothetical protein LTR78_004205 [Recurvomyces mirabilis]
MLPRPLLEVSMAYTQKQDADQMGLSADANSAGQSQDQPHLALIMGMYNLYTTLVSMGYLHQDEAAWPPQTSRLIARDWLNHGLSQELVILPGASPPDSIGMWSQASDSGTGQLSTVPIVWEPAQQVLDGWANQLRNLTWIPDRSADQGPILALAGIEAMPSGSRGAATQPFYRQQTLLNVFHARRRIYRERGWPTEQFRRDDCRAALANFNTRLETLEKSVNAALHPSMEPYLYYPEVQAEPAGQYTAFLEDAAGDEADRGIA